MPLDVLLCKILYVQTCLQTMCSALAEELDAIVDYVLNGQLFLYNDSKFLILCLCS